jgi:hypothetical protein
LSAWLRRLGLYWGTFLPGLAAGLYLIWRNFDCVEAGDEATVWALLRGGDATTWVQCTGTALGGLILLWLVFGVFWPPKPKDYFQRPIKKKIRKFEKELGKEGLKLWASKGAIDFVMKKGLKVEQSVKKVEEEVQVIINRLKKEIDAKKFKGKQIIKICVEEDEEKNSGEGVVKKWLRCVVSRLWGSIEEWRIDKKEKEDKSDSAEGAS